MTTAAIDLDTLDKLFDNQKKLDDVFDSMFDEDPFLSSPTPFSDYAKKENDRAQAASESLQSYQELTIPVEKTTFSQRAKNFAYFVLPVIELAAIYYGIGYFS